MPAKIIITCPGRPAVNGHKRHSFLWNPAYACYVFENRVLTTEEYNKIADKVFDKNSHLRPRVKFLPEDTETLAPITTLTAAREITLDEALEVVGRLAPGRLKTKPGPKVTPAMAVG